MLSATRRLCTTSHPQVVHKGVGLRLRSPSGASWSAQQPASQRSGAVPPTITMSASAAPTAAPAGADAELAQVDVALERLAASKAAWARASLDERISVLKEIRGRLLDNLLPWARATAGIRCSSRDAQVGGDVLVTVTCVAGQIDGFIRSLEHLKRYGSFPRPPTTTSASGQTVVAAFPQGWKESKLSLLGATGASVQLYLQPGKPESQGHFYREPHGGKVAVVLGAGNQHHLALSDVLHMAFVEGCVVLLKYHPIMEPAAPFIDYVLEPLSRLGFYASSTNPELAVTKQMLYSPLADCVHMTGGTATHDAIVWGAGPEQERRRAANDPLLKVPITSELGCVTPWLITPGPWSETDIKHHAQQLAEGLASNCSCNCLAPKVILLAEGWPQADAFVAAVKAELAQLPLPAPYYPGLRQRYDDFKQQYPQAQAITSRPADPGASCGEPLPYLVNELPSWPADPQNEYAFKVEPFAPVMTFVRVPPADTGAAGSLEEGFLAAAVTAANEHLWGSLSCTLLVHPETEAKYGKAVQAALDGLQYGSVCLNAWSALGFLPAAGHWGAFGGDQTVSDIGSGLGAIHNCYLFDHTQKAVVRTPFLSPAHPQPKPMPLAVTKIIAGLTHSGPWGALRLLWQ